MTDLFNPVYTRIKRRIANEVRTELEHVSGRKLRAIVRAYREKVPFWVKHLNLSCNQEQQYKRDLRYSTARDLLSGEFSWDKLDRENEENKIKEEKEQLKKNREMEWYQKGRKVEFFPGSLEEYESLKGQKYEFVNTGKRYNIMWNSDYLEFGKLGVEALVRFRDISSYGEFGGTGLPVKKKTINSVIEK